MEVPTTTVHAIASTSTSALHQSNGRRAGASSEPTTSDRFKRELVDRSFDLGEQGDDDDDQDYDSDALEDALYTRNGSSSIAGSSSIKHKAPARDEDEDEDAVMQAALEELSKDAFSEAEVDSMLQELKEIGMFRFIDKYVVQEAVPLPKLLLVFGIVVPPNAESVDPLQLLRILKVALSRALRNRTPLERYTTPQDAVELIRTSSNIVVLTGAGISTSCGIPDFRSSDTGLYARLQASGKYSDFLTDPQEMFDIKIFKENPELFYDFAKEIYSPPTAAVTTSNPSEDGASSAGQLLRYKPSRTHDWIRRLERQGKLLRNYTQNIDTLEQVAGIEKVLFAHGSFATCSCLTCNTSFPGDTIKDAILTQTVPLCPLCTAKAKDEQGNSLQLPPSSKRRKLSPGEGRTGQSNGNNDDGDSENDYAASPYKGKPLLKPDITFFGQALDDAFDRCLIKDREQVDLLIVIGTSLQVAPVSELLSHIPHRVPQILINRDPVPHVMDKVDIVLLGECDEVVEWLDQQLAQKDAVTVSTNGVGTLTPSHSSAGSTGADRKLADPVLALEPFRRPGRGLARIKAKASVAPVDAPKDPAPASVRSEESGRDGLDVSAAQQLAQEASNADADEGGIQNATEENEDRAADDDQEEEDGDEVKDEEEFGIDNVWLFPKGNSTHRWFHAMRSYLAQQAAADEEEDANSNGADDDDGDDDDEAEGTMRGYGDKADPVEDA